MKVLIITFLACCITIHHVTAQDVKIERGTDKELLVSPYALNAVMDFTDSSSIAIKLIEFGNLIGAHPDDRLQEVVLSDILLIVKERDVKANTQDSVGNFWVRGHFYNPRNYKFNPTDKSITFQHGTSKNGKTTTMIISTRDIRLK